MSRYHEQWISHLADSLPDFLLPLIERLEEASVRSIPLSPLYQPSGAALSEELVDERRDSLVRVHPVAIPTSKHSILDAGKRVVFRVLHARDEVRGVVCGLPFEGGCYDQDGPVLRQVSRSGVESTERCAECCRQRSQDELE